MWKRLRNLAFGVAQLRCSLIKLLFKISSGNIDDLSLIYNDSYFRQLKDVEHTSAAAVVEILYQHFQPKSIVDLGCGAGVYLSNFENLEVAVTGYDGSQAARRQFCCSNKHFLFADLRKPLAHQERYDLCLCFEVAEHIEEKYVSVFIQNLTSFSDIIIFTSADIHRRGLGHVNSKVQKYWIDLLSAKDFFYDEPVTEEIRKEMKQRSVIEWLTNNLLVFRLKS